MPEIVLFYYVSTFIFVSLKLRNRSTRFKNNLLFSSVLANSRRTGRMPPVNPVCQARHKLPRVWAEIGYVADENLTFLTE